MPHATEAVVPLCQLDLGQEGGAGHNRWRKSPGWKGLFCDVRGQRHTVLCQITGAAPGGKPEELAGLGEEPVERSAGQITYFLMKCCFLCSARVFVKGFRFILVYQDGMCYRFQEDGEFMAT